MTISKLVLCGNHFSKVRAVYSIANMARRMTLMTATGNKLITRTELEKLEGKNELEEDFAPSIKFRPLAKE